MQYFLDRKLAFAALVCGAAAVGAYSWLTGLSVNGVLGGTLGILLCSGIIFALTAIFKRCRNVGTFYQIVIILSLAMIGNIFL